MYADKLRWVIKLIMLSSCSWTRLFVNTYYATVCWQAQVSDYAVVLFMNTLVCEHVLCYCIYWQTQVGDYAVVLFIHACLWTRIMLLYADKLRWVIMLSSCSWTRLFVNSYYDTVRGQAKVGDYTVILLPILAYQRKMRFFRLSNLTNFIVQICHVAITERNNPTSL